MQVAKEYKVQKQSSLQKFIIALCDVMQILGLSVQK